MLRTQVSPPITLLPITRPSPITQRPTITYHSTITHYLPLTQRSTPLPSHFWLGLEALLHPLTLLFTPAVLPNPPPALLLRTGTRPSTHPTFHSFDLPLTWGSGNGLLATFCGFFLFLHPLPSCFSRSHPASIAVHEVSPLTASRLSFTGSLPLLSLPLLASAFRRASYSHRHPSRRRASGPAPNTP